MFCLRCGTKQTRKDYFKCTETYIPESNTYIVIEKSKFVNGLCTECQDKEYKDVEQMDRGS